MLNILYRDDDLVVVDKPAGLLVHRSPMTREEPALLQQLRDQLGMRLHVAHRLDRATSGVILLALHSRAAAALQESFARRLIAKEYLAIVRGYAPEAGSIDHPTRDAEDDVERAARTDFQRLAQTELAMSVGRYPTARYSLLRVRPLTGRTHQIRKHLKHIDHPIIGDTMYGRGEHNRFFRDTLGCARLLLHAWRIEAPHPTTGRPIRCEAPVPPDFRAIADRLGWVALLGLVGRSPPTELPRAAIAP